MTTTVQVAIRTPQPVSRSIVGLMEPARPGTGGGALGGNLMGVAG